MLQKSSQTLLQSLGISLLLLGSSFFHVATCSSSPLAINFKRDMVGEDCKDLTEEACIRESITIQKCPIACSDLLEKSGSIARPPASDDGEMYQQVVTKADGTTMTLEEYEGYITLFVVIPLVPNAQYYYELVEHVHKIFPFTVELLILPYPVAAVAVVGEDSDESDAYAGEIIPHTNTKSTFLKHEERSDFMIYLSESEVFGGEDNLKSFPNDRASIYIISSDGRFVERMVAPKLMDLEKRIIVYLQQLDPTSLEL